MSDKIQKFNPSDSWSAGVKDDALQYIRGNETTFFKLSPWMGWLLGALAFLYFRVEIFNIFKGAADAVWMIIYFVISAIILFVFGKIVFSDKFRDTVLFLIDWFVGWFQEYWEKKNPIRAIKRTLRNLNADLEMAKKFVADLKNQYVELLDLIKDAKGKSETYYDQSQVALEDPKLIPRAANSIEISDDLLALDEFNVFDQNSSATVEAFSMSRFSLAKDSDARVQRLKEQQKQMAFQIKDLDTIVSAGEIRASEIDAMVTSMLEEYGLTQRIAMTTRAVANFVKGGRFQDLQRQAGYIQDRINEYRAEIVYTKQITQGIVDDYRAGRAVKDYRTRKDYKDFVRNSVVISDDVKVKLLGPGSPVDTISADQYLRKTPEAQSVGKKNIFDDLV